MHAGLTDVDGDDLTHGSQKEENTDLRVPRRKQRRVWLLSPEPFHTHPTHRHAHTYRSEGASCRKKQITKIRKRGNATPPLFCMPELSGLLVCPRPAGALRFPPLAPSVHSRHHPHSTTTPQTTNTNTQRTPSLSISPLKRSLTCCCCRLLNCAAAPRPATPHITHVMRGAARRQPR